MLWDARRSFDDADDAKPKVASRAVNGLSAGRERHTGAEEPMSREEETELFARYKADGDPIAAERLLRAQAGHVLRVARSYRRYGVLVDELIAEGNLGLVIALGKFEPGRGTRFVTYATHWIRAQIVGHVLKTWSLVGGATGALRSKLFFRLRRECARLDATETDRELALSEVGRRLGMTGETVQALLHRIESRDLSLSTPLGEDGRDTLVDVLPHQGANPERILIEKEEARLRQQCVTKLLGRLDERERSIVESRWMQDEEGTSLADMGRTLGVSRERVRQIEGRAMGKLRKALAE